MQEFKRIFNRKFIVILVIVSIANIFIYGYKQVTGSGYIDFNKFRNEYNSYITMYSSKDYLGDSENIINELREKRNEEDISEDERRVLSRVIKKITYISQYKDYVSGILVNAERMDKFSLFSSSDSLANKEIKKAAQDYRRIENVNVKLSNTQGVEAFVQYNILYYIALGLMIIVIYRIFSNRDNGMWQLERLTKKGRAYLNAERILSIIITSFIILLMLFVTNITASCIIYGGCNPGIPVQSIESFADVTFNISIFTYLIVLFLVSWLGISMLSFIMWMLFSIFSNRNVAMIIIALLIGIEYFLYKNNTDITLLRYFKKINIMQIFYLNGITGSYSNLRIAGRIIPEVYVFIAVMLLVVIAALVTGYIVAINKYPQKKKTIIGRALDYIYEKFQKIFASFPMVLKEIHKLIFTSGGLVLIIAMLVLSVYFIRESKYEYSDSKKKLDEMYLTMGGEHYEGITEEIEALNKELKEATIKLKETGELYNEGKAELSEVMAASAQVEYCSGRNSEFTEMKNKIIYLEEIKEEKNINGWMISDRGYEQIIGDESEARELILLLILVIGIYLVVNEAIMLEYNSGMKAVTGYTVKGRKWLGIRKIVGGLVITIIMFVVVYAIDFTFLYKSYGMPYLNAPVQSLTFMRDCGLRVTIRSWMIIQTIKRLMAVIAVMFVSYTMSGISAKLKNRAVSSVALVGIVIIIVIMKRFL